LPQIETVLNFGPENLELAFDRARAKKQREKIAKNSRFDISNDDIIIIRVDVIIVAIIDEIIIDIFIVFFI
jgi:hypothetical protein